MDGFIVVEERLKEDSDSDEVSDALAVTGLGGFAYAGEDARTGDTEPLDAWSTEMLGEALPGGGLRSWRAFARAFSASSS